MPIPFLNLHEQYLELRSQIDSAVAEALQSGWYILGEQGRLFEQAFKEFLVVEAEGYVVGVNSGTDALALALIASGVKAGDEVITVANTAIPTVTAICSIGAIPVFAEVEAQTWLIDPEALPALLTSRTKAIVPVHLYGNLAHLPALSDFAQRHGLALIEDVAQATGGSWAGKAAGTWGSFGAFSFYPSKNLGAMGDGGAVFCQTREAYERLMMLRNYGQRTRYDAELPHGLNSRLDEIQAAILRVKLPAVKRWNQKKAERVTQYRQAFKSLPLRLQEIRPEVIPGWHLMVVQLPPSISRAALMEKLTQRGIQTLIHYPHPIYRQKAFEPYFLQTLPLTEALCAQVLSLPLSPYLSQAQVEEVCGAIQESLA